jgi:hypothetical protein
MGTVPARETLPLAVVARVTAEDFLRGRDAVGPTLADELAGAIELALLTAVRAERRACEAACTHRGQLWQRTSEQPGAAEVVRREAESRANEALYLADLIATRA